MVPSVARPRVVIVGAGFAGITLVRALKRVPVDVLVVDRNNYHLFTPLVYEVASALLNPSEVAQPVRALLRGLARADFMLARVEGFDLDSHAVLTDRGLVKYDHLVVAAGSVTNYLGSAHLEASTSGLKDLDQALALRNRVMRQFEFARWTPDPERRRTLTTFAVVGGGPTGVEYAGALSELVHLVLRRDFRNLDLSEVRIVLVEGSPNLLGAFEPRLRARTLQSVERKGIEVMTGTQVESLEGTRLHLSGDRVLDAGTVIWTAGVKANPLGELLPGERGRGGTVRVEPTLQLPAHPEVLVIGDMAALDQGGSQLPQLAPVAMQEAKHAARVIADVISGREPKAFRYHDKGIMATIGRNAGVAQIGPLRLWGWPGWIAWLFLHLLLIVSLRSRLVVLINWTWDYIFYDRPVRLVLESQREEPAIQYGGAQLPEGAGAASRPRKR